jgi:hypothetical protein
MGIIQTHFPVFEANQVLTSAHLNDVFNYLDEQSRLTRSKLIGIGIVCGLDIKLESGGTAIRLSKGCGVTSEGYLIVEPADVSLVSYRANYILPTDPDYPPFKDTTAKQFPLWELFAAGEPNTTPLGGPAGFLDDKAVLLFLELKKRGLRNCSPNSCDDKGAEVATTLKRLLIQRGDLDKIIAAANTLGGALTSSDLASALLARLNLPDLRLPRFDVLKTGLSTSHHVYGAFLGVFHGLKLSKATADALTAAYTAFKPLLQDKYPSDPFGAFNTAFGFLDDAPATTAQVKFLQYYFDLFDDLLRAYDEFRWKGAEIICACCPPEGLFPRHLMLGLLHPEKSAQPGIYRHGFLASAAVGECAARTRELLLLFDRLVEITKRFTNSPALPPANDKARTDPQIRMTPTAFGDVPLSVKAIPYYYQFNGSPPLYRLWSDEKTRRNRANQNLSYRSDEYVPTAPAFVSGPLRYDLEPFDFLRVEGHLGKNYQRVLSTLLLLKSDYRLPIEIVALRSGAYDEAQPVDLSKETARFQDLEALYDSLREELLSALTEGIMSLYDDPIAGGKLPGGVPLHPLLKSHAPNYRVATGTVGAWYEKYLSLFQSRPYIDVNQNKIDADAVLTVYCTLFAGTADLPNADFAQAVSIYYFSKLAEILPSALDALGYADFENKYQDLLGLVRFFRSEAARNISTDLQVFIPQEELIDQFDQVLFNCKLGPIKSIHDEYVRRVRELRKKQFLATFLERHPGIQHKAGVPLGGTFIVVYHHDPAPAQKTANTVNINAGVIADTIRTARGEAGSTGRLGTLEAADSAAPAGAAATAAPAAAAAAPRAEAAAPPDALASSSGVLLNTTKAPRNYSLALTEAISRISRNQAFVRDPDIGFVLGSLTGDVEIFDPNPPLPGLSAQASDIIAKAVNELADGTVVADFFLPYLISPDYAAMQFVLPSTPPMFTAEIGCPDAGGTASVTVKAKGGSAPYEIDVDKGGYQPLTEALRLKSGTHTLSLRDAEGIESATQSITIAPPIAFGAPDYQCNAEFSAYTATIAITGGTPPYSANGKALLEGKFTSDPIPSGTALTLEVIDSKSCSAKIELSHTCVKPPCDLPCAGIALRRGYRFWVPEPERNRPYRSFRTERAVLTFEFPQNATVDLSRELQTILGRTTVDELNADFARVVTARLEQVNKLIADRTGKASWLTLGYESTQPGRLGTLWIEYFECLKFDLQVMTMFQRPETAEQLNVAYLPGAMSLQPGAQGEAVKIPAFDGTRTDKCEPTKPVVTLCPRPPDIALRITKRLDGLTAVLNVTASGSETPVAFLWEIQEGRPAMSNATGVTTVFPSAEPRTKLFTVTAFNKDGCRVTLNDSIELRTLPPIRPAEAEPTAPSEPATPPEPTTPPETTTPPKPRRSRTRRKKR